MEANHSAGVTRHDTGSSCDSLFWPAALGCDITRFDFSLFFEQTVLGSGPYSILLLCTLPRLIQLGNDSRKASYSHRFRLKFAAYSAYIALQLSLLIGWSQNLRQPAVNRVAVATAALGFADALALCLLSYLEHSRSVRPSTIICAYLVFSTLFDAVQCRTLWLMDDLRKALAPLFSAMLITKVIILVLEVQGKRSSLLDPWRRLGPEATSGIASSEITACMASEEGLETSSISPHSLTCSALKGALALSVIPRLCLIGFKFAQPFLIQRVINLVQEAPTDQNGDETAYVLILATALIYLGTAIALAIWFLERQLGPGCIGPVVSVIGNTPTAMAPIITFGIAIAIYSHDTQQRLSIATVFTSLSIISLMTTPLSELLFSIPSFVSCLGSFDRIQAFLEKSQDAGRSMAALEHDLGILQATVADIELSDWQGSPSRDRRALVTTRDASFAVSAGGAPILHNISLNIMPSTLTIVTGNVGSGKSMLLLGLLGELHAIGSVTTSENGAAYCSQSTWLVHGSIRQNILGLSGHGIDETWYQTVVQACALDRDFQQLTAGDQSSMGNKGLALSGGQRHRVALARGLYSRKPLLLVDDVLSSLDATTRNHVWNRVFGPSGLCRTTGTAVVLATHFLDMLQETDNIVVLESGHIKNQGTLSTLRSKGCLPHQAQTDTSNPLLTDKGEVAAPSENRHPEREQVVDADKMNDLMRRSGDSSLYWYYFKSFGWSYGLVAATARVATAFFLLFPQIWLKWWTEANTRDPNTNTSMYFGIYAMFLFLGLVSLAVNCWFMLVQVIPKSAQALHWTLLETVMRAPLSFFVSTDSGDLVNRFSQDMSLVDKELPIAMFTTSGALLTCIGEGVLIILGAKYLAAAVPLLLIVLFGLQKFYLCTSRQLRFLDL
ncbi:Multidrug resistance-associated protein 1 [Tolypocladium ophioglossoides CBS 100239]|uniref:Multidrug resistance-associated protein 1 n=1 Tax=Tolypocladium ophioglossoides (strain CBS 100239) TaxID=1163406 RepID=A0A0L0NDQ8_TOLOC|nr:Multidrug resistance-associated protein 1 [Tolypocladium ophioglossoides CBS 100239]